jgi:hypothetical protein
VNQLPELLRLLWVALPVVALREFKGIRAGNAVRYPDLFIV